LDFQPQFRSGVAVLGGVNQDTSLRVPFLPLPGETVIGLGMQRTLGGKAANQAIAAARSGVAVTLLAAVGDDAAGSTCLRLLKEAGVDIRGVVRFREVITGQASVWVDQQGQNAIVVTPAANGLLGVEALATFEPLIAERDVLVVQGEISSAVTIGAVQIAERRGTRVVINLAPYVDLGDAMQVADPLVVNEVEASQVLTIDGVTDPRVVAVRLAELARSAVLTLGSEGAIVVSDGNVEHVPVPPVESVVDTTGAGDAFVGVLAASLSAGLSLVDATRRAVSAGTASTQVHGAGDRYPFFPSVVADGASA
jgi:ribokinase